jgi:hypothetical protein
MRSTVLGSALAAVVLTIAVCWLPGHADNASDISRRALEPVAAQYATELTSLRDQINATEGARVDLIEEYLDKSAALVYMAKAQANVERSSIAETNQDLHRLVDLGYLKQWPLNPLSNFEPMKVLSPSDKFSAGDLVLELCPAAFMTTMKGNKVSGSFNLYVYGLDGANYSPAQVHERNARWSVTPSGAAFSYTYYISSDLDRAEAKRNAEERKRAEKAATAP